MKNRLVFIPAFAIVVSLFIVGTFLDLNISNALYSAGNGFARFMSAFTFFPLLTIATFICGLFIRFVTSKKYKKVYQNILLILFALILFVGGIYIAGFNACTYDALHLSKPFIFLVGGLMAIPGLVLGLIFYKYFDRKNILKFIVFIAVSIVITVLIVEITKRVHNRIRYLALVRPDLGNLGLDYFSPWYSSNVTTDISTYLRGIEKDLLYSFPSGHSNAGMSIAFVLMFVPILFPKLKNKQILFFYIGFAYFLLVAFMRIVIGMHYMSDVMFAGTCALIVYFIANEIYLRKFNFIGEKE